MTKHLNLMSEQARVRECVQTRLRQWSRLALALLALFGLALLLTWWPTHRESQHRARMEAQYEPIRLMKAGNKSLQNQIAQLREEEQFLLGLSDNFPTVNLLGLVGQAISTSRGETFLDGLTFHLENTTMFPQNDSAATLTLDGLGTDRDVIGRLTTSLQQTIPFASIQLESINATEVNEQSMHNFTIECSF